MNREADFSSGLDGDGATASRSVLQVLWVRKGFVLLGALLGLGIGFLYHTQRAPVYQTSCQLLVIKRQSTPLPVAADDPRRGLVEDYMAMHIFVLRSPLLLERAVKKRDLASLKSFENAGDPVGALQAGLTVSRDSKETNGVPNNIILLSYRGPVAEECGKILSAVLDAYEEFLDITYRNVSDETLTLIRKARNELDKDLKEAKQRYLKFRQESPTIWRSKEGLGVEQERVASIEAKRSQLLLRRTELAQKINVYERAIKEGRGVDIVLANLPPATTTDKGTAAERYVKEPLLPLLLQEMELLDDFGPDHPRVKNIRERIKTTREYLSKIAPVSGEADPAKRLVLQLRAEEQEIDCTLKSLEEQLDDAKKEARHLMQYEDQESMLRTDEARLQQVYDSTVKRLTEIGLARDSGGFKAQPLSTPGVGAKVSPVAYIDLSLGLMLGILLGAGLAYLADMSDKSFRGPEEIRNRLGVPLVGHIPLFKGDPELAKKRAAGETTIDPMLVTQFKPKSLDSEAYRAVRTSLFFSVQGEGHRVVQLTSPNKGDGKSLLCANLAITIAQSGKRVLILDADCRRPRQHRIFDIHGPVGLSGVLSGETTIAAAVRATPVAGLDILPCGTIPPNPSELLVSPRFKETLEECRRHYDFVLVDTPPVLAVTDPCIVAGKVDGVLLTIRLTRRGRPDAERACEILEQVGTNLFGIVVNGVTRTNAGIYSAQAYDYTDTYESDEPENSDYYAEDDPAPEAAAGAKT
jgi:capsular exopolysaccharide synthesis family protein